jgi:hypothetical protein
MVALTDFAESMRAKILTEGEIYPEKWVRVCLVRGDKKARIVRETVSANQPIYNIEGTAVGRSETGDLYEAVANLAASISNKTIRFGRRDQTDVTHDVPEVTAAIR